MDMLLGPHAEDPHDLLGLVGQRVVDRLGKGRMIVRRVVVDEQDLVVRIGHHLGDGVEADRRPLVQVVAVAVVAAVEDDGKHRILALLARYGASRDSSLRAAAYSIKDGEARSTTSRQHPLGDRAVPGEGKDANLECSLGATTIGVGALEDLVFGDTARMEG